MPLNRPALALGSGPRGVQDARRWVVATFEDMGRADLLESAEMGASELVTNALLHGTSPIEVRVRGTREHPRVEVRDASTEAPVLPEPLALGDEDDLLLTFGRGLSIVARASDAWGAEIEPDGKVVWFAPAREFADDEGPVGRITGTQVVGDEGGQAPADLMEFALDGVPVRTLVGFERHFRELRREVRLLALAHEDDYPLAKDLANLFTALERPIQRALRNEQVAAAQAHGRDLVDLRVHVGRAQARDFSRFLDLLDLTDAFCREEKLLSLARTSAQREFQTWFLGEFARQAHGEEPRGWHGSQAHDVRRTSVS